MHYKIRYRNKPHDLRLSSVHIYPLGKGIWFVSCDLNLRGYDICGTRSESLPNREGSRYHSVYFTDDKDIRAELILYPDTKEEADLNLSVHQIAKHSYHAIMVSSKCFRKKWDEYCEAQFKHKQKRVIHG